MAAAPITTVITATDMFDGNPDQFEDVFGGAPGAALERAIAYLEDIAEAYEGVTITVTVGAATA